MNIESVEKLLDETAEARQYQQEIADMLANNLTLDDEEAVQDELLALQQDIALEEAHAIELPDAPVEVPASSIKEPEPSKRTVETGKVLVAG